MIGSLSYLFWILLILAGFLAVKYKQSKNKPLFFKAGIYKPVFWIILLLATSTILFTFILPEKPVDLSFLKFHSEEIAEYRARENPIIEHYLLKAFSVITEMHVLGLIAATFILGIWLYFIRSLDFFNTEKISTTLIALFSGIIITFFTFPLSDLINDGLHITYSDNFLYNLFVYCGLGIGVVEETIKALPVLLILFFTKEIDEPFDLIYYASVSALGFAFTENLIYFRDVSGSLIVGRALMSAIGHMIFASIAFYGVVLARYKFRAFNLKSMSKIILFGLAGAFLHGLYDFLLFEKHTLLFIAAFIFSIRIWLIIINNAVNNSKYFDYQIVFRHDRLKFNIAILLVSLLIFGHLVNGLSFGIIVANEQFFGSFVFVGMLIFFYVSNMSSLDLFKGHWRPMKFVLVRSGDQGQRGVISILGSNAIYPLNHVGKMIELQTPGSNQALSEVFDTSTGKITDRIKLVYEDGHEDIDWFLVELSKPMEVMNEYRNNRLLIKIRNKAASLIHDSNIDCWLKIIPQSTEIMAISKAEDFLNCGKVFINGIYETEEEA